jgi:hypothetical protein
MKVLSLLQLWLLGIAAQGTESPTLPSAPEWLDNGWHYIGCRVDFARTLSQGLDGGRFQFTNGMTLDFCRERAGNSKYFAVAQIQYVAPAVAPPSIGNWRTLGCWSDGASDRTLRDGGYNNYGGMTLNECLSAAGNARYAGVEYGGYV